ncbi:hypothetical protein, partial [Salmonella enterica]
ALGYNATPLRCANNLIPVNNILTWHNESFAVRFCPRNTIILPCHYTKSVSRPKIIIIAEYYGHADVLETNSIESTPSFVGKNSVFLSFLEKWNPPYATELSIPNHK